MSAEVRAALATAANTVEGVSCNPYYWQATKPRSAMVRLDRIDYPGKPEMGGWATWQVWVVLPSDLTTAEQQADDLIPLLVGALSEEMTVESVALQTFVFDTAQTAGVVVSGRREA